jgi:hypothetical protein
MWCLPANVSGFKKYIYRTNRGGVHIRFHELFRDFKYENDKCEFAQNLIYNGYSTAPMEHIMEIFTRD